MDWSVVHYFFDGGSGRKEAEMSEKKKPESLLVPALVLAGCPDKTLKVPTHLYRHLHRMLAVLETRNLKLGLSASTRTHCQIAHLRQNARHLHSVQLRDEWQDFGDELIFHQFADFFLAAAFTTAE